jgi:GT2 family glycosyltransferase
MPEERPEISVVMLTWNRKDDLAEAIDSVLVQQGVSYEIIVVDNASTDGTRELIQSRYPQIRYIRLPYNLGVSGRNFGMANARGELVFLLDDDVVLPDPHLLATAYQYFQKDAALGVLFGARFNYFDGRIEDGVSTQNPDHNWSNPCYTYNFRGGAEFIRRRVLEEIGYFDPLFFREKEERDLSMRVLARGSRILYVPSLAVRHKTSPERFASGPVQSLKFLHELIVLWTYYPFLDAALFSAWDTISSFLRSLKEKWLLHYLRSWFLFLFRHLPFTIPRRRRPLPKEIIQHIYALNTRCVCHPEDLPGARISLMSFCWHYLSHHFLPKRKKGRES